MAVHIALTHRTAYRYDRNVSLGPHVVRLRPAPHCRTPILSYSLKVEPEKHFINWQQDPFSNYLGRFVFVDRTDHLEANVEVVAEMAVYNPFNFFLESPAHEDSWYYLWKERRLPANVDPGSLEPPPPLKAKEFPFTLDLRQHSRGMAATGASPSS